MSGLEGWSRERRVDWGEGFPVFFEKFVLFWIFFLEVFEILEASEKRLRRF